MFLWHFYKIIDFPFPGCVPPRRLRQLPHPFLRRRTDHPRVGPDGQALRHLAPAEQEGDRPERKDRGQPSGRQLKSHKK